MTPSSTWFRVIAVVAALFSIWRGVRGLDEGVGGSVPFFAVFDIVVGLGVIVAIGVQAWWQRRARRRDASHSDDM